MNANSGFLKNFKAARRTSTPLVAVRTADQANAIEVLLPLMYVLDDESNEKLTTPALRWDVMRGLVGVNEPGKAEADKVLDGTDPREGSSRPTDMLGLVAGVSENSTVFALNFQRFINDAPTIQGVWNLRDPYKATGRMLVLLMTPGAILPPELSNDIFIIDQPLPTAEALGEIVTDIYKAEEVAAPDEPTVTKATDAVVGLPAFPAEQAIAMSMEKGALNTETLWERKRKVIEQTPGLSVWRGGETFEDIGGVENIKKFLRAVIAGKNPPRVVVFIDEIEKAFAGTGTDTSGVKTEMTGTMLSWMQDKEADGCIFIGPPGAAKSCIAKATGNTAGIPTVACDFAAMQNSLVGASGERLRAALQIIDSISQGRALFIATCNSIASLPPELRRRFTLGTFFFDLPTADERDVIWSIYQKKYNVSGERPIDDGWTGAEIKECCRKADRLNLSLIESAKFIVPVSVSAKEQISELRRMASGKFISASRPGIYSVENESAAPQARRAMRKEAA